MRSGTLDTAPSRSDTLRRTAEGLPLSGATTAHRRVVGASMAASGALTLMLIPYATNLAPALPGFVPAYQTAVFLFYAMATFHLVGHARRCGSLPLLHIAAGCLFSSLILLMQMFSFPIWGAHQLVGSTPATTSWLWTFWHLGPTVFTFSYVTLCPPGRAEAVKPGSVSGLHILTAIAVAVGLVGLATAVAVWAVPWLPVIVTGDDYRALTTSGVGPGVLIATLATLGLLVWRTRCATPVELCLALALWLLAMDDTLTLLGGSRLSWGWYAGRAEAAVSAAILLGLYILEMNQRFVVETEHTTVLVNHQVRLTQEVLEQHQANAALALMAREDGLTKLANRRHFDEMLALEWQRAQREETSLTLIMIDIDHFKLYNDRLGHQGGDMCLQAVAKVIASASRRPGDLAARYGGEEFVLLLANTDPLGGAIVAERLRAALRDCEMAHPGSPTGHLTVSMGAATCVPEAGLMATDLLARADHALYRAKAAGRDRIVEYKEGNLAEHALTRPLVEADLRQALDHGEFCLFYQPQVDLQSGAVTGFEALLRWEHPVRGMVLPPAFIPVAEACGLMRQIGAWVLRQGCADAATWPAGTRVAINLSPAQFDDPALVSVIEAALDDAGLSHDRLDLELTEALRFVDLDNTAETLEQIRALGIGITLDDFGCGYSSLAYLNSFPANHIKIDRAFVKGIGNSERSAALVKTMTLLATSLRLRTTAEGIETAAQAAWCREAGIETGQGYFYGRPQPGRNVPIILRNLARRAQPVPVVAPLLTA